MFSKNIFPPQKNVDQVLNLTVTINESVVSKIWNANEMCKPAIGTAIE